MCLYNTNGDKIVEQTTDSKGKVTKKSIYTYDKNGLKIEKKTTDSNGIVVSVKKYSYGY